jgi:hypothetical protein
MKTITIINDFHNTETRIRVGDDMSITKRQYQRARRALCGIQGCTCGGDRGGRYQLVEDLGGFDPSYYVFDREERY